MQVRNHIVRLDRVAPGLLSAGFTGDQSALQKEERCGFADVCGLIKLLLGHRIGVVFFELLKVLELCFHGIFLSFRLANGRRTRMNTHIFVSPFSLLFLSNVQKRG